MQRNFNGKTFKFRASDPQVLDLASKDIIKEFELAKKETATHPELIPFWEILLDKYPENTLIECEKAIKWSEYILGLENIKKKLNQQKYME